MPSLLRRFFGDSSTPPNHSVPAPVAAAPADGSSTALPATAGNPSRAGTGESRQDEPPSGEALQEQLRATLDTVLHQLETELAGDRRGSADVLLLVRTLLTNPIAGIRQLPVAAQRALSLLHSEAPTNRLVELFEHDPAIAQALLRQVNSAYYNPSGAPILSLSAAITRTGRSGVQAVILQQSVAGMVSRPGGDLDAMVVEVWNHMARVAPLARQLATAFGVSPDKAFLAGLLHDVGKLVVFDAITELRTKQRRLLSISREVVGQALQPLHEPLGGLVVHQWRLDAEIVRAVGRHHRQEMSESGDPLSEVIYAAEQVDVAQERKEAPDLDAIWSSGSLRGDQSAVAAILEAGARAA